MDSDRSILVSPSRPSRDGRRALSPFRTRGRSRRGATLLHMLGVIAVLGTLSAVLFPRFVAPEAVAQATALHPRPCDMLWLRHKCPAQDLGGNADAHRARKRASMRRTAMQSV